MGQALGMVPWLAHPSWLPIQLERKFNVGNGVDILDYIQTLVRNENTLCRNEFTKAVMSVLVHILDYTPRKHFKLATPAIVKQLH